MSTPTTPLIVLCNIPDRSLAQAIASTLIEESLAACVNILAPCQSTYRWQGQIECVEEHPLLIKTVAAVYPQLEQRLCQLHPYEVPEVIAWPVSDGLSSYLEWVQNAVRYGREPI